MAPISFKLPSDNQCGETGCAYPHSSQEAN